MSINNLDSTTLQYRLERAKSNKDKLFSILIDPDKLILAKIDAKIEQLLSLNPDLILMGGSLIDNINVDECIKAIKSAIDTSVFLFPGSPIQYSKEADGLLFLSLISGRNPDLLIGRHIEIAPTLVRSKLEILPTGYMLVNEGNPTSASYISNTQAIPANKWDIALATAQAGQLLGLKAIYMDAGSGAQHPIPINTIQKVANGISVPLIIGGGIRTEAQKQAAFDAGANMVVMGTVWE